MKQNVVNVFSFFGFLIINLHPDPRSSHNAYPDPKHRQNIKKPSWLIKAFFILKTHFFARQIWCERLEKCIVAVQSVPGELAGGAGEQPAAELPVPLLQGPASPCHHDRQVLLPVLDRPSFLRRSVVDPE